MSALHIKSKINIIKMGECGHLKSGTSKAMRRFGRQFLIFHCKCDIVHKIK
jgi:hypothetical protein